MEAMREAALLALVAAERAREHRRNLEDVETEPEMSSGEDEEYEVVSADDGAACTSTRELLQNAEQGLKDAMAIMDDIANAPGVLENDYMRAVNLMMECFVSIRALSERIDAMEHTNGGEVVVTSEVLEID